MTGPQSQSRVNTTHLKQKGLYFTGSLSNRAGSLALPTSLVSLVYISGLYFGAGVYLSQWYTAKLSVHRAVDLKIQKTHNTQDKEKTLHTHTHDKNKKHLNLIAMLKVQVLGAETLQTHFAEESAPQEEVETAS